MEQPIEEMVSTVDLLGASDEHLLRISREGMLALNLDEMLAIKQHFLTLGRNPTDLEIETLASLLG